MTQRLRSALIGLIAVILALTFMFTNQGDDTAGQPHPQGLDIFILAGQSNMSGRGRIKDLPKDFPKHVGRLWVYGNAGKWVPASEPVDSPLGQVDTVSLDPAAGVGPGLAMADELARLNPELKIGLVPCALSGSYMDQWSPNPGRATLYGSMLARAKEARAAGRLRGLVWYQGESDTMDPGLAEGWPSKFKALVAALRHDLDLPDLPVIFTQLSVIRPRLKSSVPAWDRLKALQAGLNLPNVVMVKSDGLQVFDGIHLDTASQMILGRRYAQALQKMLYTGRAR